MQEKAHIDSVSNFLAGIRQDTKGIGQNEPGSNSVENVQNFVGEQAAEAAKLNTAQIGSVTSSQQAE